MKALLFSFILCWALNSNAQFCEPNSHSLFFDGQTSYVSVPTDNQLNIEDDLTIEAWIYPMAFGATSAMGSIVCKHGWTMGEYGYVLRCGGNGELSFTISGMKNNGTPQGWQEVESPSSSLQLNVWQHVAATYDGSKMRLYIDGNLVKTKNYKGKINCSQDYKLKIGRVADAAAGNGRYFEGKIDEVRIWHRVLSQSEIDSDKDEQVDPQNANDLVGYWRFNDEASSIPDDFGTGNNPGTLMGASFNTDVPFTNGVVKPLLLQVGGTLSSSSLVNNQWNRNGIPIPGETGIAITPSVSGYYSVTVMWSTTCIATSDEVYILINGIQDIQEATTMNIHVADNRLFYNFQPEQSGQAEINIYDLNGRFLYHSKPVDITGTIDLNFLSSGIYMMLVTRNEQVFQRRFLLN